MPSTKRKARPSAPAVKPTASEPEPAEPAPSKPPTQINPYRTLDLERDASEAQIKSAYRKAALKSHPGRPDHPSLDLKLSPSQTKPPRPTAPLHTSASRKSRSPMPSSPIRDGAHVTTPRAA
jgi:hypothetical protein